MGRPPRPDDLILPSVRGRKKGAAANTSARGRAFKACCLVVGIEPRHQYTKRHTLVRMLRDAQAAREVVRWATHAPPSSVYDGYADEPPWELLCQEFLKLPLPLAPPHAEGSVTGSVTPRNGGGGTTMLLAEAQRNRSLLRTAGTARIRHFGGLSHCPIRPAPTPSR